MAVVVRTVRRRRGRLVVDEERSLVLWLGFYTLSMGRVSNLQYRSAASAKYHRDGQIEIDDNAKISRSPGGGGAYVQAWAWVYDPADQVGRRDDGATIAAAQAEHAEEGYVEVDDGAEIHRSVGGDAGAYVEAWVWIDDDDAAAAKVVA